MNEKSKNKLIRANFCFQKRQLEWLEQNKQKTGTSGAELLRRLLNEYIQKYDK
jgi:hypothetical protein